MRYGVLADIHGNLPALEATLALLDREGVDGYLCAGDLVGYGPFPNECVAAVAALDAICVAGNHDLIALGLLSDASCIRLARETLAWTRKVLEPPARDYLAALPPHARVDTVVIAHGELGDPQAYTRTAADAAEQLARLAADHPSAELLVLGHTHEAAAWSAAGSLDPREGAALELPPGSAVLNPGGVGQSRERAVLARAMLLDLGARSATFYALPYDVERCRHALRSAGLPDGAFHLHRSRVVEAVAHVRRAARRATAIGRGR